MVRLKTKEDPNPGESRSKQICTLPITLQGLPKNALETKKWHDDTICNGVDQCLCKKAKVLTKENFRNTLLDLSTQELEVDMAFHSICNGASLVAWGKFSSDEREKIWNICLNMKEESNSTGLTIQDRQENQNCATSSTSLFHDSTDEEQLQDILAVPLDEIDDLHKELESLNMSYDIQVQDEFEMSVLEESFHCLQLDESSVNSVEQLNKDAQSGPSGGKDLETSQTVNSNDLAFQKCLD